MESRDWGWDLSHQKAPGRLEEGQGEGLAVRPLGPAPSLFPRSKVGAPPPAPADVRGSGGNHNTSLRRCKAHRAFPRRLQPQRSHVADKPMSRLGKTSTESVLGAPGNAVEARPRSQREEGDGGPILLLQEEG
ncbi:unnamed protein product [Gadus morhua 'NCC']